MSNRFRFSACDGGNPLQMNKVWHSACKIPLFSSILELSDPADADDALNTPL